MMGCVYVYFVICLCVSCDVMCSRLYVSEERTKLPSLLKYLEGVKLLPYSQVVEDLQAIIKETKEGKVWISDSSAEAFVQCVPTKRRCGLSSPIQLLKGVKNEVEISGMKACHVRGGHVVWQHF